MLHVELKLSSMTFNMDHSIFQIELVLVQCLQFRSNHRQSVCSVIDSSGDVCKYMRINIFFKTGSKTPSATFSDGSDISFHIVQ